MKIENGVNNMLENKVAIITGGTRGIGFATAKLFLENKAKVAILGSREESVNKAIAELKNENSEFEVIGFAPTLHNPEEVKETFAKVKETFGKIDILVNNAGMSSSTPLLKYTEEEYDKIAMALEEVRIKGYGIVTPQITELKLEEPEIVKQGNKYGVKLKASAPSIHMIRADIETEVSPIVGSEKQSEDLIKYLLSEFETDPTKIWESNIFGKSLHELVNEGLQTKLSKMPEDAQIKLQETLERIVNEGSGGLICIIL